MTIAVFIALLALALSATAFYVTITVLAALAHDQEQMNKALEKTMDLVRLLDTEREARRLRRDDGK